MHYRGGVPSQRHTAWRMRHEQEGASTKYIYYLIYSGALHPDAVRSAATGGAVSFSAGLCLRVRMLWELGGPASANLLCVCARALASIGCKSDASMHGLLTRVTLLCTVS